MLLKLFSTNEIAQHRNWQLDLVCMVWQNIQVTRVYFILFYLFIYYFFFFVCVCVCVLGEGALYLASRTALRVVGSLVESFACMVRSHVITAYSQMWKLSTAEQTYLLLAHAWSLSNWPINNNNNLIQILSCEHACHEQRGDCFCVFTVEPLNADPLRSGTSR